MIIIVVIGQVKKKHVSRPDFYKKESGRAVFLLFIISYCMLTFPQELLGQILIKRNIRYWLNTSLFNFDTHKGLTVNINIILVYTQQQLMGFTSDACWFLLLKSLLTKNNKKKEAALKNEAGGDKKHVFFFYLALWLIQQHRLENSPKEIDTRADWLKIVFL